MTATPYSLPLNWATNDHAESDQAWLEKICANAAPFSDWWTKARVVQLAHPPRDGRDSKIHQGLTSEAAIVAVLHQELQDYCSQSTDTISCSDWQTGFCRFVTEEFVAQALEAWEMGRFTMAIGRNFEVYRYVGKGKSPQTNAVEEVDRLHRNTFLVTSTASASLSVDRTLPDQHQFRPLFNVDQFANIIQQQQIKQLTLRTHGYASPIKSFQKSFMEEARQLFLPEDAADGLPDHHLYIGYHWPSEQPVFNFGLVQDALSNLEILLKFLGSLLLLSGVASLLVLSVYDLVAPLPDWIYLVAPWVVFVLWFAAFSLLRAVVYQRDRYRAIHYGAPDLAEFFWRLDKQLKILVEAEGKTNDPQILKRVNMVGHSMGGLVVVNALRVLGDRFGKDDSDTIRSHQIGTCLKLDKLILASPDVPLEFLKEGRNNYVRSAIRRCQGLYLFSSDRDTVLRYLSTLANWFSEPSVEMSGLRLGNVFLKSDQDSLERPDKPYELYIRGAVFSKFAVSATSALDLFEQFNFLDCSTMKGVNGVSWDLNPWNALVIDLVNTFLYFTQQTNVHGGYFQTKTPSFRCFRYLLYTDAPGKAELSQEIARWDLDHQIKFLACKSALIDSDDDGRQRSFLSN